MEWFRQHGSAHPVLFTADHQMEGKGQRNRPWHSEPGKDLSMSLALPVDKSWVPATLNMKIALAVRNALLRVKPENIDAGDLHIKWPNDIYISHRGKPQKVAGILVENVWKGADWSVAIVGIGMNILSQRKGADFQAISVKEAWDLDLQPIEMGASIAQSILAGLSLSADETLSLYNEVLFGTGQPRMFVVDGQSWLGILNEVNHDGRGRFDWLESNGLGALPEALLPSSQVSWCWTSQDD